MRTSRRDVPIGHTLKNGAYRVETWLQGEGVQQLFLGRHDSQEVLIAIDLVPSRIDLAAFRSSIEYACDGVFALEYVGRLDMLPNVEFEEQRSRWALVERVPPGAWLPSFLGTHEPYMMYEPESRMLPTYNPEMALADALGLGRSAGRILSAAAARGLLLAYVRPELMWACRRNGVLHVTGLSARAHTFFSKTTIDAVSLPLFDRYYYAKEAYGPQCDDRTLVFALAIMIAEWATGRFPFKYKFHDAGPLTGKHLRLKVPTRLAVLLSKGMQVEAIRRPRLREFLDELDAISP